MGRCHNDMQLFAAPRAKNARVGWAENLHGRCPLGYRDMERPIIHPCHERGASQQRRQLPYRHISDDERGRLHTPGNLFQHWPLVFASSEDDTGWRRECQGRRDAIDRVLPISIKHTCQRICAS